MEVLNLQGILETRLPELVESALDQHSEAVANFDAILVDEAQDFNLTWWNLLRRVLRPGGEMLMVADITQDLYGRSCRWTESSLENAGFRGGRWFPLEGSHRCPAQFVPYLREFAERFVPGENSNLPSVVQPNLFEPICIRWLQASEAEPVGACVAAICDMPSVAGGIPVSWSEVTLLVGSHAMGLQCVAELNARGIQVNHVFGTSHATKKENKLGFWMGDARLKAATIHSFKGWESRAMVVHIPRANTGSERAAAYVALSRLKRSSRGSVLTVVCSAPELEDYGRTWPEFARI